MTAAGANTLTSLNWTASSTESLDTGVAYVFYFTTATTATLTTVTMTLPTGSVGSVSLGPVTGVASGGTISRHGTTLTYTIATPVSVAAGTAASIEVDGVKNTPDVGSYTSTITTNNSSGAVDTGTTPAITINGGSLTALSWSASSDTTSVSGVTYSYGFKTRSADTLTSVSMTVPAGTLGSPSVTAVSGLPSGGTASLVGSTLTYSFSGTAVSDATACSLSIDGLTNTSTPGSYTSTITTNDANGPVDSGTTSSVSFSGVLTSLSWTASSTESSATGVSYVFGFTTASSATLASVQMTVPAKTGGSLSLGPVSGVPSGGTLSKSGSTITYTLATPTLVSSGTAVSIEVDGVKNTTTIGSYTSTVTTNSSAGEIDSGTTPALPITGGALSSVSWTSSSSLTGATGVTYSYGFTTRSADNLTAVTISVPAGTGGSPSVSAVSGLPAGGTVALASNVITYSFTSTAIAAGTTCSLSIGGLTNTTSAGTATATVTTEDANGAVDSGTSNGISFGNSLTALSWSASSNESSDSGVSYTFGFTTGSSATLASVTMALPAGTAGSPGTGTVTGLPAGGTMTRSGSTLTYSFAPTLVGPGTAITIEATGLKNTATVGSYTSTVTTYDANGPIDSGNTPSLQISGGPLSGLSWSLSSNSTGASATSYSYGFDTRSNDSLTGVSFTVPPGTSGSPSLTSVTGLPAGGSLSFVGTTLTYSFTATEVTANTACSVVVGGLTNSTTAGTSTAVVTTYDANGAVDSGTTPSIDLTGTLSSLGLAASSNESADSGVTYTFSFTTASTGDLVSASMTLPAGTTGSPSVSSVTGLPAGGSVNRNGTTLTYSFGATEVPADTSVTIAVGGLNNTTTIGAYTSSVATNDANGNIDLGTTPALDIVGGPMSGVSWTPSSTGLGATGVSYSYAFTTRSTDTLVSLTATVPSGTSGTPSLTSVSGLPAGGSLSLVGTVLTYSFSSTQITAGTSCTLVVGGLTNTEAAGAYNSDITTNDANGAVDTGTASASFGTILTLTPPTSLSWSTSLGARTKRVADTTAADEQLEVNDETGSGAGWSVSVSATTFVDGAYQLADSGTFYLNGSTSNFNSANVPTASCLSSCTLPTDSVTYPVAITTAPSAPVAVEIYNAALSSGKGDILIGGSNAANPIGWWVVVPATAYAGTYTSTVTISLSSGP